MNILNIEHISKIYGEKVIFDDVSLGIHSGDKIGVIGVNGTGKTTLLKIIAKINEPDKGQIICGNGIRVSYLPQNPEFPKKQSILEYVMDGKEHQDWKTESEAKTILTKLGIYDFDEGCDHLSGGQKKRVALARTLVDPTEVLILDEPTNHLDNDMVLWLEEFLNSFRGVLIMVTHDRYFLDRVTNKIVEIDKGKLYEYDTNYSGFVELKVQREEMELATERKRQSLLRVEMEWMKQGIKARGTRQRARTERFEELKNAKGPSMQQNVEMDSISSRLGKTTLEVEGLAGGYPGHECFHDFSYIFLKGDRIGFIGANGSGKTTLMKMIAGRIKPDAGTITVGATIKIGYYTQEIETGREAGIAYMDPEEKVIDYIRNTAEYVRTTDGLVSASNMLERFLFPAAQQYSPIGKLSGGERRRLNLLRVLMEAPNVLILDEPTNDLDTQTLAILEDYLDSYEGIVIVVSHDRYFLDRVVRRIFAFEGNGEIRQYEGGYTDYVNRLAEEGRKPGETAEVQGMTARGVSEAESAQEAGGVTGTSGQDAAEQADSRNTWKREKKLKFSYKEQREYETIEDDIANLEAKVEQLDADMAENATNSVKLGELLAEKEAAEQALEEKMERWEYLEELAAKIAGQE